MITCAAALTTSLEQQLHKVVSAIGPQADLPTLAACADEILEAATLLGWRPSDPAETIPVSVRWHLENPPAEADGDFSADDRALAAATGASA